MKKLYIISVFCFFVATLSCQRDNSVENSNSNLITLNSISKCKNEYVTQITVELGKEGFEYSYDNANKILHLIHVNADFNCGINNIEAKVNIENGIISVEEKEIFLGSPTHCECVYDIQYSIQKVEPTVYTLKIPGLKDVIIDLANNPSGSYYEPRETYPWKIG